MELIVSDSLDDIDYQIPELIMILLVHIITT